MLTEAGLEASYMTTYVEDYLEAMDGLPNQVQPHLSEVYRLDAECKGILDRLMRIKDRLISERQSMLPSVRSKLLDEVKRLLYEGQVNGDQKIVLLNTVSEMVAVKCQQLDSDVANLEPSSSQDDAVATSSSRSSAANAASVSNSQKRCPSSVGGEVRNGNLRSISCNNLSAAGSHSVNAGKRHSFQRINSEASLESIRLMGSTPTTSDGVTGRGKRPRVRVRKHFEDFVEVPDDPPPPSTTPVTNNSAKKDRPKREDSVASTTAVDRPSNVDKPASVGRKRNESTASSKMSAPISRRMKPIRRTRKTARAIASGVDPDEPTYCLCDQVSFGEMIGCDYAHCGIEWFHFECVELKSKPKGKCYCPSCRGDRVNSLKTSLLKNGSK